MTGIIYLNTQPYCTCAQRGVLKQQDGYVLDRKSSLWVCTRCRKPSRMNYLRVQLGEPQIPQGQNRREADIFWKEKILESMKEVEAELGGKWEPDSDGGWDWNLNDD